MKIDVIKEAEDYFSHNPQDDIVGFALLTQEQLSDALSHEPVEGEIEVLKIYPNPDEVFGIANERE